MFGEFRTFINRGNVLDLAVGVIIGAAFAKIVASLTDDLLMPVVGAIFGGLDFPNFFLPLASVPAGTAPTLAAMKAAGVPVFAYGSFVTATINFLILAFIIFLIVRAANRALRVVADTPTIAEPPEVALLREIRDTLQTRA